MLVSVVMPIYNASNYLEYAIDSLLNQTYTNWELIAVDDGSTDNSWELLQSYMDPRIKKFKQKNGGQCVATNTALKHVRGEYIQFFDADDLMDRHKIEVQVKTLNAAGKNAISVCKWAFFTHSVNDAIFKDEAVYYSGDQIEWLCRLWSNETMMPNHGYFIPRALMENAGIYYDETIQLNIDFEYFTRMVMEADQVIYCPDAICYYRKSVRTSKTFKPSFQKQISALNARIIALDKFLKRHNSEKARHSARMALTILTFSFPAIRKHSKKAIRDLGLQDFGMFGGPRFKMLSDIVGFENAIRIKALYQKLK